MSGKYGPKENSVMTWERFISTTWLNQTSGVTRNRRTVVGYVNSARVSVSEGGDMQVG